MRKPRVVIFDDDAMLLELLQFYFEKWGYEVLLHQSPLVCLFNSSAGRCNSLAPCADLMISDFEMPQITGLELFRLQEERGCKVDRKMKAIMSSHADDELLRECRDSGYRFFEKPFYSAEIYDWVNECEKSFDLSKQLGGIKPNKRHEFRRNIEYCPDASRPNERFIAFTVNKSFDGLGLRVFNPLSPGQEITIINGLETPNLKGTVVWCKKVGERSYRAGLYLK